MATPLSSADLLHHLVYHVLLPPKLPQSELEETADRQLQLQINHSVISAVHKYKQNDPNNVLQWDRIIHMLERLSNFAGSPVRKNQLSQDMMKLNTATDSVLPLHIRAQNAAVLIRKKSSTTIFEAFEVQAPIADVMSIPGKLKRYYPGPAIEVPNSVANDVDFIEEISSFLTQMDTEEFEQAVATTRKGGSKVHDVRDSANPNYFVQLFFGILRGMGREVEPRRVAKRIADEVLWKDARKPWRRSPIWLIIRVAIQTSLDSNLLYKHFMAFYYAEILSQCQQHDVFSSDLLYTMRVKMGGRVYKVKDSIPDFVVDKAKVAAEGIEEVLQRRWTKVQGEQIQAPEWDVSTFNVDAAKEQTLPNSRPYLNQVFQGRSSQKPPSNFTPNHHLRLENVNNFTLYAGEALAKAFSEDKHIALFDFESSVYKHLSEWTSSNLQSASDASITIFSCFHQYLTAAQSHYTADVADQSIMILTLMKLWVAIDELATYQCPLLRNFSPELPKDMLDSLLLHTSQHIEQARAVQQYLCARHNRSSAATNGIFSGCISNQSFSIQYFRQSSSLRSLKSAIERDAQHKRDDKKRELEEKNGEHARLEYQASHLSHEYIDQLSEGNRQSNHSGSCQRCAIERERDSLKIAVHEWPLPADRLEAEAVVFELERPAVFTVWRDATYQILRDLGVSTSPRTIKPPVTLEGYVDLCPWLTIPSGISARVIMASSTRSFVDSHYSEKSIPTDDNQICVNNGLKYQLYDVSNRHWVVGSCDRVQFTQYGTLKLPENSSYRYLQYALEGTAHTSNTVLANQFDCPEDVTLHEHIAFGTLRSGPRLQWMNILRGLEENILTFSSGEVNLLHTQSAWQIGPLAGDGRREWHEDLLNSEYGTMLISESMVRLDRIRANWLEATSVSTSVMLVSRLLTSSTDPEVLENAYQFLREAQRVTLGWLAELQIKLKEAMDESVITDYQHRVCEIAAICRSTFDVDPHHVPRLLATPSDLSLLIKCSIALYDNKPPDPENVSRSFQVLLSRDRRLAHKILPYVLQKLRLDKHILCGPIADLWPHFRANPEGWVELPTPDVRWISISTAAVNGQASQRVHLNLLEGSLLIDGQPLGRLPRNYVDHPTYTRVLGQTILDVIPASSYGMKFATRDRIHGYQVSFLLDETCDELVIQAHKDSQTWELVPFSRLTDDFPEFLSTDYHHWAHLEHGTVEFRPLSCPWASSERQWLLSLSADQVTTVENARSGSTLVDIHSSLFRSLSRQLESLESPCYHQITVSNSPEFQIQVELPRMKLSFFVNEDMQIESNDFCGHIVDNNQSTGTMFGLQNQLVLCARDPVARTLPRSRAVLIPHGEVRCVKNDHHVAVTIQLHSDRCVPFHHFLVDTDLGNLSNHAGLTSRLFKIYLHALTSYCLPDPLTGRTGTEEALHALSESATSSFEQINEEQGQLLGLIGSLTPSRKYYPAHLRCMQTTEWSTLPPLSQHFAFSTATAIILKRADTLQLFWRLGFDVRNLVVSTQPILLQRVALRTLAYYPTGTPSFLKEMADGSNLNDVANAGREALVTDWVGEGQIAAWAARLAYQSWGRAVYIPINLVALAESWKRLERSNESLALAYSSHWLKLNFPTCWITLYNLCRRAAVDSNRFRLSSCIASAAFSRKIPPELMPVIIAFATNQEFANLAPPTHSHFLLTDGYQPSHERVRSAVSSSARPLPDTPAAQHLSQERPGYYHESESKQRTQYQQQMSSYRSRFAQHLISQWPSTRLQSPSPLYASWFVVKDCLTSVQEYFSSCNRNVELRTHLRAVEQILSSRPPSQGLTFESVAILSTRQVATPSSPHDCWRTISISNLMRCRPCPDSGELDLRLNFAVSRRNGPAIDTSRLSTLFSEFEQSLQPLHRRYGLELNESREDLAKRPTTAVPRLLPRPEPLDHNRQIHHSTLVAKFDQLKLSLGPLTSVERILSVCGVWPRITPRTLLQQLALGARLGSHASSQWQTELKAYARLFVDYQRSQRLVSLAHSKNVDEFWKELDVVDAEPSVEEQNPDWLLVQIDGNFSARSIQRQVAKEMISPSSGSSSVLQLNMGEGKSSVIVPIIAAALADTTQLVRVIVLKPLWHQMFHLLVNRLSGLVNRRIYYLPFGRHVRMDASKAQQLEELYVECLREGGILLAQPEHVLSFKLMGIDKLISAKPEESQVAQQLRSQQEWITDHARDILDESDEILHARYQLVYTVGDQKPVEDHPDRWTTTQQILKLLARRISHLKRDFPESFHYEAKSQGQFPTIRIMSHCKSQIEEELIHGMANDILGGHAENLNCASLSLSTRSEVFRFLTTKKLPYSEYESLKNACDPAIWHGLLLVRGLLASGILVFALKERHYRVDYGLDLKRSLVAVPFRAKDIPSPRAEFGHPDVAIVLTSLSYYYKGITENQLQQCFELLYKLDNPYLEYEQWVGCNNEAPSDLRQLNGVNIKDHEQFRDKIVPTFAHNSAVIDFFLSSVVFPKAAKEFPYKLSTSGWDLVESKQHVTTGFSGTNDNRYLLPTPITQADPVKQLSTNALVLAYILQPENNHYMCMRGEGGQTSKANDFLELLVQQQPEIRVLLDVGAQMLELQNEELVRCWLTAARNPDIKAAVYFNEHDELSILPRDGTPSSFYSSPFAQRLDKCIVYLDDGHTRGTDLKLPRDTRALVTLGPKVTKDRLLQGCMRMRKLGRGQSVMFAAPPEIDSQIREASPRCLGRDDEVDALDVLRWAMLETCKDLQHHVSHWAQQGIEHSRRAETQRKYGEGQDARILKEGWLTTEAHKLEEMYGVLSPATLSHQGNFMQRAFNIPSLRERLNLLGIETLETPGMDEEQEREVSHEVERESEVKRPPKGRPAVHAVHQDVRYFIQTGCIPAHSSGFVSLLHPFNSFGSDALAGWSKNLLASVDFSRTLADSPFNCLSDYMRPVNWVIQAPNDIRVALSPFEINELLPLIRQNSAVSLHIYAPRVSRSMRSFSNLDFYSIPSRSSSQPSTRSEAQLQLDIFAGQLYLSGYHEYMLLSAMLGHNVSTERVDEQPAIQVESNEFVNSGHRFWLVEGHPDYPELASRDTNSSTLISRSPTIERTFANSPIPMLKELIGLRRKGMSYLRTHVGKILHGQNLSQNDF